MTVAKFPFHEVACESCKPNTFAKGGQKVWFVLRTRARQEKAVARFLRANDSRYYLPLVPSVTMVRGRKLHSEKPLFPGYVFLCGQAEEAYGAVAGKRVCQILTVEDQQQLERELQQVRRSIEAGMTMDLYPFAVIGRRCRIKAGPLVGIEGVLVGRCKHQRFVVQVNMLGQGATIEIDADLLEAAA